MKIQRLIKMIAVSFLFLAVMGGLTEAKDKIKVLIVTGGHDFERQPFFDMFKSFDGVEFAEIVHPKANQVYTDGTAMQYDVIAMYDLWQDITDEQKQGLLKYLAAGKGLVVMHHALACYQNWPEFLEIAGGTYILDPKGREIGGKIQPPSTYLHDVQMTINVVNKNHPIADGISSYQVTDETYGDMYVNPAVDILLSCNHPTSSSFVGWAKNYGRARVAAIQGGHDHKVYENPNYRKLLHNAIRWTANASSAVSLFNGKDLNGWEAKGAAKWTVEDGVLTGHQGDNFAPGDLFTQQSFKDFELVAEFKVQWPANSGVWFRYHSDETTYQADILEYKNPLCWSGSLYCPGKLFIAKNENPALVNREDWNTFVIRCKGDQLTITLNGTQVADVHDSTSGEGKIGLQVHPGEEFKDMAIWIRKLELFPL
ncbi:MAG: family 16 glycoside hydrolase [Candidatus Omnitrophota bacterium]